MYTAGVTPHPRLPQAEDVWAEDAAPWPRPAFLVPQGNRSVPGKLRALRSKWTQPSALLRHEATDSRARPASCF